MRPWEYYPFANTLAAAASTVLSRGLGWLDPFDGFHAVNLLFAAALIWIFFGFLHRRWGLVAAAACLGLLFGSPRVVCHLMANIKDFPLMVLFSLTAVAFLAAFEAGSTRGLLAAGALLGLSLATKANALFFPAIPLGVLLLGGWPEAWRDRKTRLILSLVAAGVLGVVVMFLAWPYLWADPLGRFSEHLEYIGFRRGYTRPESLALVLQAGAPDRPARVPGAVYGRLGADREAGPAPRPPGPPAAGLDGGRPGARYLPPQAVNFDGVRHFLELLPAMAAVAGLGAAWLGRRLANLVADRTRWSANGILAVFLALVLLPSIAAVARTHPFQIAYWNAFAGGYDGARARDLPQASDYWGMSYRLGIEWLNDNAPEDALLAVPVVEHAVRLVAGERLRPDILLLPVTTPFSPRIAPDRLARTRQAAVERPLYVMFVEHRDWATELMIDCLRHLEPEAVWELEGAPVLSIYRYRWPLPAVAGAPAGA